MEEWLDRILYRQLQKIKVKSNVIKGLFLGLDKQFTILCSGGFRIDQNCMKMKKNGLGGGAHVPCAPLNPPLLCNHLLNRK